MDPTAPFASRMMFPRASPCDGIFSKGFFSVERFLLEASGPCCRSRSLILHWFRCLAHLRKYFFPTRPFFLIFVGGGVFASFSFEDPFFSVRGN